MSMVPYVASAPHTETLAEERIKPHVPLASEIFDSLAYAHPVVVGPVERQNRIRRWIFVSDLENSPACPGVAISWLSNRAGINDVLTAFGNSKDDSIDACSGTTAQRALPTFFTEAAIEGEQWLFIIAWLRHENAWPVRVPLEANRFKAIKERSHPFYAEAIVGEHVFIGRITTRPVNTEKAVVIVEQPSHGKCIEEIESSISRGLVWPRHLQSILRPEGCVARHEVEVDRFRSAGEVVVAQECQRAVFLNQVDALHRIWAITDHVTQADDPVDTATLDLFENRLERDRGAVPASR